MTTCDDIRGTLSRLHDNQCGPVEGQVAAQHASQCAECGVFAETLTGLDRELQEMDMAHPSTGFAARTARRVLEAEAKPARTLPTWTDALWPVLGALGLGTTVATMAATQLQIAFDEVLHNSNYAVPASIYGQVTFWQQHLPVLRVPSFLLPWLVLLAGLLCQGLPALWHDVRQGGQLPARRILGWMGSMALLAPLLILSGLVSGDADFYALFAEAGLLALLVLGLPLVLRSIRGVPAVTAAFVLCVLLMAPLEHMLGGDPTQKDSSWGLLAQWLTGASSHRFYGNTYFEYMQPLMPPNDLVSLGVRFTFGAAGALGAVMAGVLGYHVQKRLMRWSGLATGAACLLLMLPTAHQWTQMAPLVHGVPAGNPVTAAHPQTIVALATVRSETQTFDYPIPASLLQSLQSPDERTRLLARRDVAFRTWDTSGYVEAELARLQISNSLDDSFTMLFQELTADGFALGTGLSEPAAPWTGRCREERFRPWVNRLLGLHYLTQPMEPQMYLSQTTIKGRLQGRDGRPLVGVAVRRLRCEEEWSTAQALSHVPDSLYEPPITVARTDSNGRFILTHQGEGKALLAVLLDGANSVRLGNEPGIVHVPWPEAKGAVIDIGTVRIEEVDHGH